MYEDLVPLVNPTTSLLSTRRPSWTPSLPLDLSDRRLYRNETLPSQELSDLPHSNADFSSPDGGGTFRRSLQIDMKSLVGDAVGSMSISPTSRDVVLATRRGLFIIDLEAPFEVPRFLPQGGTWDVADVQWNTHPSRSEYIVSTSGEKLLIWNLFLVGKTSIDHILSAHQRTVTDINWALDPDIVGSTGIDSWLWAWDLREPRKPIFGFSAFNAGGTQVKWNRKDENILASSHSKEVLIWDRRKGSLPLSIIKAHNSKIYGIDWSHNRRNEIVTCSLDKTIKLWDIQGTNPTQPTATICTAYPVWRARDLPFGQGVLSLPQRGSTELEMWANGESVETFVGHSDVVKEFVWRKSGTDFQLITWSKDRTLRFWPLDFETMEKVGYIPSKSDDTSTAIALDPDISFRNAPAGTDYPPALSVPVGHRSILAEVRAPVPPRHINPVMQPHQGSGARGEKAFRDLEKSIPTPISMSLPIPMASIRRGGTMSRRNLAGRSARMDAFTWLSNVKVDEKRESSGGHDAIDGSRLSSRSRPPSNSEYHVQDASRRHRSSSWSRANDDRREGDGNQSLQDEITSVLTKLASSKIKLEKHDLIKKRTCTLGLHGPWGESSSVFIRVTFTFPREYPQGHHPDGTPTVELERNPLISMKDRAFILRQLRFIREQRRPCLEACLRFLLYENADEHIGVPGSIHSVPSSDDEASQKVRDLTVSLLRNNKNLAEPRTSQGIFGPNGELICFFRAPPRIVRNPLHTTSVSPTHSSDRMQQRFFQPPALLSDAIRRLGLAATDRGPNPADSRKADDRENILRIMTNLLTFSQQKIRRDSESLKPLGDIPSSYSLLPCRSMVFINNTADLAGADRTVAMEYVFDSSNLAGVCDKNAVIAREHGRYDHERVFRTLRTLFATVPSSTATNHGSSSMLLPRSKTHEIVFHFYSRFCQEKDVQILAMVSILLIQAYALSSGPPSLPKGSNADGAFITSSTKNIDEDCFRRTKYSSEDQTSSWRRLTSSPIIPVNIPSSRGSWSSLFNAGSMRQFMTGVQDTFKDGLSIPSDIPDGMSTFKEGPIQSVQIKVSYGTESPFNHQNAASTLPKSCSKLPLLLPMKSSSSHIGQPTLLLVTDTTGVGKKQFAVSQSCLRTAEGMLGSPLYTQLLCHIMVYSEILFGWQLFHKRLELLKSFSFEFATVSTCQHRLGLAFQCPQCSNYMRREKDACSLCSNHSTNLTCSVCRLPVKGLLRSCICCRHVTHITCWKRLDMDICMASCIQHI